MLFLKPSFALPFVIPLFGDRFPSCFRFIRHLTLQKVLTEQLLPQIGRGKQTPNLTMSADKRTVFVAVREGFKLVTGFSGRERRSRSTNVRGQLSTRAVMRPYRISHECYEGNMDCQIPSFFPKMSASSGRSAK
jgi:hypothetical protein